MRRTLFRSKIHRATVTEADLDYEGSVTIDATLMRAADILPYEKVHIWNRTNGHRLETYALEGEADSGVICVNGAAARLVAKGDKVIIAAYCGVNEVDVPTHLPKIVLVDERNRMTVVKNHEGAGVRVPA